jgi:hypothetical protein
MAAMTYPAVPALETNRIIGAYLGAHLRWSGIRWSRDGSRSDEGYEGGKKDEGLHDNSLRCLTSLKENWTVKNV